MTAMILTAVGILALAIWLGLWLLHAAFWRVDREPLPPPPQRWPAVTFVGLKIIGLKVMGLKFT
jgi:hypothetical protein